MYKLNKLAALVVLLLSAGCGKADVSDARRDYLLAKDHGWIDLNLMAPVQAPSYVAGKACMFVFSLNGEPLYQDTAFLSPQNPSVGYRFVAPAGKLDGELRMLGCVSEELVLAFPVAIGKDHLATLNFDGKSAAIASSIPFAPTSLEWVRTQIVHLQGKGVESDAALNSLTRIAIAGLALNALALLGLLALMWRRRP